MAVAAVSPPEGPWGIQNPGRLSSASAGLVGQRIKAILERRGVRPKDYEGFAIRVLGMKRSNFYNVLNGTREPTLGELLAMVQEFELRSIEELIAPFGTSELRSLDFGFEDP